MTMPDDGHEFEHTVLGMEVQRLSRIVGRGGEGLERVIIERDADGVWYSIHAILSGAANIAKVLWPSDPQDREQAEGMRAALEVTEESPLRDRRLRNHFEHFDERLRDWLRSEHGSVVVDANISDEFSGMDPDHVLRHFWPTRRVVSFRGEDFDINELILAARGVGARAPRLNPYFILGDPSEWQMPHREPNEGAPGQEG